MMWVWQGSRVNSWLAGCLAGCWLVWCCCLVVETGSWCWFGAAAWWWKLEADADLVLLPGGGSWKLMLIWCCCLVVEAGSWFGAAVWWWKLEAEADLLLILVSWISGAVPGPLGCADSLILLILLLLPDGGSWKLMLIFHLRVNLTGNGGSDITQKFENWLNFDEFLAEGHVYLLFKYIYMYVIHKIPVWIDVKVKNVLNLGGP